MPHLFWLSNYLHLMPYWSSSQQRVLPAGVSERIYNYKQFQRGVPGLCGVPYLSQQHLLLHLLRIWAVSVPQPMHNCMPLRLHQYPCKSYDLHSVQQ